MRLSQWPMIFWRANKLFNEFATFLQFIDKKKYAITLDPYDNEMMTPTIDNYVY